MKKTLIALLCITLLCSCIKSQKSSTVRTVKIINETSYELIFSEIDNGGDVRLWPQTGFTLQPNEEYYQCSNQIYKDTPVILAPVSMKLECNGKTVVFSQKSTFEKNPCNWKHYYELDNFSVYGPGIHYELYIWNEDIEKWFPGE